MIVSAEFVNLGLPCVEGILHRLLYPILCKLHYLAGDVGLGFASRSARMFFGARFFRIRGSDVRSAIMCFDLSVQKYRTDSQLSLSNQSTATSEQWEAEGPDIGTSIYGFFLRILFF